MAGKYWRSLFLDKYAKKEESPEYDLHKNTVLRVLYQAVQMKVKHQWSNESFDAYCRMQLRHGYDAIQFPQNWHTARSALGARDIEEQEYHVCPTCGRMYDWCSRAAWGTVKGDKCKFDGTPRFTDGLGPEGKVPFRRVWLRSLDEIIASFLSDPRIARHLGDHRVADECDAVDDAAAGSDADSNPGEDAASDPGSASGSSHSSVTSGEFGQAPPVSSSIWQSPYLRWLDDVCNNVITSPKKDEMAMLFVLGVRLPLSCCVCGIRSWEHLSDTSRLVVEPVVDCVDC